MLTFLQRYIWWIIYAQVWGAFFGSLYFSEVLNLPPCVLCVVQRWLMYPLIIIITYGLWSKDRRLSYYVLPFSIAGMIVAFYHNLLYWKIIPLDLTPCTIQLPCTVEDFSLFGFITIPLMSFVAFSVITAGVLLFMHWQKNQKKF